MRLLVGVACIAACSFSGAPGGGATDDAADDTSTDDSTTDDTTTDDTTTDDSTTDDSTTDEPDAPTDDSDDSDDSPMTEPAPFVMSGARWLLPCTPGTNGDPNPTACRCSNAVNQTINITGTGRWLVTVRVRGVMERMRYTGGVAMGSWYVGGGPSDTGNNVYELRTTSPDQRYFLNHNGNPAQNHSWTFDYMATFEVDGGATVTFRASGQDGIQWEGVDSSDNSISIQEIEDPPQPFNGQFAVLEVTAAEPI